MRIAINVAVGDRVLLPEYGGHNVKVGEDEFTLYRDGERRAASLPPLPPIFTSLPAAPYLCATLSHSPTWLACSLHCHAEDILGKFMR